MWDGLSEDIWVQTCTVTRTQSCENLWRRVFQAKGMAYVKALEWDGETAGRSVWLEQSDQGQSVEWEGGRSQSPKGLGKCL